MKYWISLILFFTFLNVNSQDKIFKKDFLNDYESGTDLRIKDIRNDTLYYTVGGFSKSISETEVIAVKRNCKEKNSKYVYLNPQDERIYGINKDVVFFKSDYKFTVKNSELSKECFLEKFRVYDFTGDFPENKKGKLFIRNKKTGRHKRIPKNTKICIYLKDDVLKRRYKGRVYSVSGDTSRLILKIGVNGEKHIYSFQNNDISSIGIEAPPIFVVRHTLALMSISTVIFAWTANFYYRGKWYHLHDFNNWQLAKN